MGSFRDMDYSISVDHLHRDEVLNQLQIEKSQYDTKRLKKSLKVKLKKCHPIWSSLKKLETNELRRFATIVNIETAKKIDLKIRIEIANYFFETNPSTPLTAFEKIAYQSYPNTDNSYDTTDTNTNKDSYDFHENNSYENTDPNTNKDTYNFDENNSYDNTDTNIDTNNFDETYSYDNTDTKIDTDTNIDTNTNIDNDTNINDTTNIDNTTNLITIQTFIT